MFAKENVRSVERSVGRDIALVCLADGLVGASFGAVTVADGMPVWLPIALSLLVFAGSAQFAAVGVAAGGGGPVGAVAAGLLLNTRVLPFGLALADVLGKDAAPGPRRWLGAHLLTDETAAFALAQPTPERRRFAFWASGLALFAAWNACVAAGALAAGTGLLGDPDALGLDAAYPVVLAALVAPSLRGDAPGRRAAGLGAALAVALTLLPGVPAGVPVLAAVAAVAVPSAPARGRAR
ncbi:branched-chain amino acid permease [Mangrovactinospora gilvigrisea]|uniref:Branched-chain amino acid permease n=1 Tax=Mangrovactinospora gilvigrisea TaxID=1428644 RepID=A0A1J7C304_9ACTN|nr:AzlC family ABC transporter permease [Mangrovactinospora gilvigrisea]OIV35948.1 branched-chain amino acid permease [Mangrovactinospora gilvigrisea]